MYYSFKGGKPPKFIKKGEGRVIFKLKFYVYGNIKWQVLEIFFFEILPNTTRFNKIKRKHKITLLGFPLQINFFIPINVGVGVGKLK